MEKSTVCSGIRELKKNGKSKNNQNEKMIGKNNGAGRSKKIFKCGTSLNKKKNEKCRRAAQDLRNVTGMKIRKRYTD